MWRLTGNSEYFFLVSVKAIPTLKSRDTFHHINFGYYINLVGIIPNLKYSCACNPRRDFVESQYSSIIVPNITDLTYHVRIWESTFLQRKDSSSGQESYLSQFL